MNPLRNASPPVISPERLPGFLSEVFWNLRDILVHHQRMLGELFVRQRDQHPLIQSVTDIILDSMPYVPHPRADANSYLKHPCFGATNMNLTSNTTLSQRPGIALNSNEASHIGSSYRSALMTLASANVTSSPSFHDLLRDFRDSVWS